MEIKRGEIVFIYDIKDGNPNGDPLDSNKPRIDEETGINIVTDVRLKRTIRDYLYEYKGYNGLDSEKNDIFVRETPSVKGEGIKDGKARATDFLSSEEEVLKRCIDVRLFGGVLPLDKSSITFTGPVQFGMGRSMHRVQMQFIKGTGAFASSDGKKQATFREEYILPYSIISFHGIINDKAGEKTNLTSQDLNYMIEGIIEGTKNLITRSKFGQMPRIVLRVDYSKKGYFIGELDRFIKLVSDKKDEELRDIEEVKFDMTSLKNILEKNSDKIDAIHYYIDERITLISEGKNIEIENLLLGKMKKINY